MPKSVFSLVLEESIMDKNYKPMPNGQKEYIADSLAEYLDKQ